MASLSGEQVAQVLYQAGFRGTDLVNFTAIAKRESGYQPRAHRTDSNPSNMTGDMGLLQINSVNWPTVSRALGLTSKDQLFDPLTNARAAKVLFDASGYFPWNAGPGGWNANGNPLHGTNVSQAQQYVARAEATGMLGASYDGTYAGGASNGGASTNGGAARNPYDVSTTGQSFEGGSIDLPSDAKVFKWNQRHFVLFDLGGVAIQYEIEDPSLFNLPGDIEDMSSPEKTAQLESLNRVMAGDAAELATVSVSFGSFRQFWDSILGQVMGYNNPARNDAGVLAVIAEFAARPDMTEAELQNRLQATDWFQNRTQKELEWNSLSEAERDKRRQDEAVRMADTYFQFAGERPDPNDPRIRNYLDQVASGKMGYGQYSEIVKGLAADNPESPWSRTLRSEEEAQRQRPVDIENTSQRIRETMERWGLNWSNQTIQAWAKDIVEKNKSDEDLIMTLRKEAQVLYPWKDPEVETAVAAAPWLETYRRTMETSATVNTSDVQRALVNGQSPWEFEQELKKNDKWLGTRNGQETVMSIGAELGRRMGFVA